ncbi:hypothetical protein [Neptunicella marina]|uniref:Uncharacterized protein n=1 Tax=Neptunicella marina TaxID=2125989 RepID=A0A8J6M110_9ALTE|nr:hypothetical protein [Neptunicella marina]MBC3767514.1 hypothetical protein [Neptunicella marina]
MDSATSSVILVATAIFISLLVERILEILMCLYRLLEVKYGWYNLWNQSAQKLQTSMHHYQLNQSAASDNQIEQLRTKALTKLLQRFRPVQAADTDGLSISAERVRHFTIRLINKINGMLLGIALAFAADIDIICAIKQYTDLSINNGYLNHVLHLILTGIAMGLGSAPLHKIIIALEKSKKLRKAL